MTAASAPSPLTVPEISEGMDACAAAMAYAADGWYVGPLRRGTKDPGSRLGNSWQTRTTRDRKQIIAYWAGTDDGVFLHCGRSGAIVVDLDRPQSAPDQLTNILGLAPYQATRPSEPGRGHYVFAVPPGRRFGNSCGLLGTGWGEMRGENGVIVVAPSSHENAAKGGVYAWARTGVVPVLPALIANLLPDRTAARDAATDAVVAAFLAEHVRSERLEVLNGHLSTFRRTVADGGSRHVVAVSTVTGAMKEARAGYYPALHAHQQLQELFVHAVTDPNRPGARSTHGAATEWAGIVAWAVAQANDADLDAVRARVEERMPPTPELTSLMPSPPPADDLPPELVDTIFDAAAVAAALAARTTPTPSPLNLPRTFYDARPALTHIRDAAHARGRSADATLVCALARVATATPPTLYLPPIVGGQGSLNILMGIIGGPGSGKSTAKQIAGELVPLEGEDIVDDLTLGSGEGLTEAYLDTVKETDDNGKKRDVKRQVRTRLFAYVDEGRTLNEAGNRDGATIFGQLCTMWTGLAVGQANAGKETFRRLDAGSYRLGAVVGFQPDHAAELIKDAPSGTPQRFVWAKATDPTIPPPDERCPWPGPLEWEPPAATGHAGLPIPHAMKVAPEIEDEIRQADYDRNRGAVIVADLDGHEGLVRLKLAGILAVLDGRTAIDLEDWALAAMVCATSRAVRTDIVAHARQTESTKEQATTARVARREVAVANARADNELDRCARVLVNRVRKAGSRTRRQLKDAAGRYGSATTRDAIEMAVDLEWLLIIDDKFALGRNAPA